AARPQHRVSQRARPLQGRRPRAAGMAGAPGRGPALPRRGNGDDGGPGSGGVRPAREQRGLGIARRAAGGSGARMGAVIRRAWLALVVAGGVFGCAEWAAGGPGLGGPKLSIVPVFGIVGLGGGIVLLDDLDVLRVVVRSSSPTRAPVVVADTTVPVDEAGNATITVPVVVVGSANTYLIDVQGIRSRDGAVLYTGSDAVTVLAGYARPVDSVPVAYVGPCGPGAGCRVTVAPQDTTVAPAGSFTMRVNVDSAGTNVAGVPVALTNLNPELILVGPNGGVTALVAPTGGAARVVAAIRGAADTLRLTVAPLTAPAAVLVNPGRSEEHTS